MIETDADFLNRLQPSWPGTHDSVRLPMSDFDRLFSLARKGAEGWRPIETAEHDEEVLLGWWQNTGLGGKDWITDVGKASYGWRRGSISNMSLHGSATHWQPLPSPPQQENE